MITLYYKRNEKSTSRIDSCTNLKVIFEGETVNTMPDPKYISLSFNIEDGVEATLDDLISMMGKRRFKKPLEFNFKIRNQNIIDEFKVYASPIYYTMPDTSNPTTEMTLEVRYDNE